MPIPTALQKKLLANDSDEECSTLSTGLDEPSLQSLLSKDESTNSTKSSEGLSLFTKQQLLTEVQRHGGVSNSTQSTRIVSKACNKNPRLFGDKEGRTPRNRRKQCKNFITKLKACNKDPKDLQKAIDNTFATEAIPDEFEESCISAQVQSEPKRELKQPTAQPTRPSKRTKSSNPTMPTRKKQTKGNKQVVEIPTDAGKLSF